MTFKSFYNNQRNAISNSISGFNFWQKAAFCALCCERALPNYFYYAQLNHFGQPELLKEIINVSWNSILNQELVMELEQMQEYLEQLNTDEVVPDSSESMHADWAQDAAMVVYDLVRFLIEGNEKMVLDISSCCIETTQKYVFENYGYVDDNHPNYEVKMLSYDVTSQEITIQRKQLKILNSTKVVTVSLIDELRLLHNNGKSNIGF